MDSNFSPFGIEKAGEPYVKFIIKKRICWLKTSGSFC